MDASASRADAEYNKLFSVYVKIQNPFPPTSKHKTSVAKYTRLSELDLNSKGPWTENKYSLEPRLRRIIAIEEPNVETTRSLKSNVALAPKMSTTGYSKRKIVTIEEDEKKSLHPKFSRDVKNSYTKMINRAVETGLKDQKLTHKTTSRLSNSSKYSQDGKQNLKTNSLSARKEASIPNFRSKQTKENPPYTKGKESQRNLRSTSATSKISQSKRVTPSDSERAIQTIKNKLKEETKDSLVIKRIAPKERFSKTSQEHNRMKSTLIKEISESKKPITVIHVPLEEDFKKQDLINQFLTDEYIETAFEKNTVDCIKELDEIINFKDVNVGTDPIKTVDQITETVCDFTQNSQSISNEIRDKSTFDSLEIPNVTLIKDKEPKENIVNFNSQSLPNLRAPAISVTPNVKEKIVNESCFRKSTSYIISTATLTYTTKQKINFHVVENEPDMNLTPCTVSYPMNVISVYKKEIKGKQSRENTPNRQEEQDGGHSNDTEYPSRNIPPDCLKDCDRNKLMKPSDIISSINADNSLVPNDYINEQFQRELNFIDSFLESLQYLESCSLTENRITQSNVDNLVNNTYDLKKLEYDSFFSKFDNSHNVDDRETMASKSLCLLNLLIRDEQRRAKNLLFVLKMREDALKDFTKSQILWLENRKKQDNTDISTLKKKQRGALLKLQHECGEMQRMRKALLTLSEKRKVALMKTKRNIELKFKNPVDVEQIIIEKRKLKRSTSTDRNTAPLKCFDLSSSGCEESTTSRPKSITPVCILKPASDSSRSAEKYVQTGDSILSGSTVNQSTSTADENFVVVDGGYLNILFQNLTLPEIFSSGKQYEVNEEALRNIVTTTNSKQFNVKEEDVIKKFMDQVKSQDTDRSSSPSTARSLVEELDLYYKALTEKDKSPIPSPEVDSFACEVKDVGVQMNEEATWDANESSKCLNEDISANGSSVESVEAACLCEPLVASAETQCVKGRDDLSMSVAGPLPVPAGAAALGESSPPDQLTWTQRKNSSSSTSPGESSSVASPILYSSMSSLVSPAQSEAEELRRQQLAIEREIKALEQQQCQLLVVREIPDKPPPPYTPPSETRSPKPRKFCVEPNIEEKVHDFIANSVPTGLDEAEPFDAFLMDYCQESLDRQRKERGDKFWDTCHDLPPKPQLDAEKLAKKTTAELREVLTGVTPTVVSGVGARRSDHIDDILFAEWRRCEPEWTSLHTDEVIVKNQLFESIFQKILTETIDEYKKTVLAKKPNVNVTVTL